MAKTYKLLKPYTTTTHTYIKGDEVLFMDGKYRLGFESFEEYEMVVMKDWFEEVKKEEQTQDSFVWTDELVDEYGVWYRWYIHEERKGWKYFGWNKVEAFKDYKGFPPAKQQSHIPKEESKDAELVRLLRDCVSETWGNPSLDETQLKFDQFLHKRGLAPASVELINKFISNKVNEILLDKKYTQQQLEEAERKCFNAGRNTIGGLWSIQIKNFMYKSYEHYKSLFP